MIVELRRNLQLIVPRSIVEDLGLQVGDQFEAVAEDGCIKFVPVVVYPKYEAERLERLAKGANGSDAPAAESAPEPTPGPTPGQAF